MKKILIIGMLLYSLSSYSQTTIKYNVSTGGTGWKRVAFSENSVGRGYFEVTLFTTGGASAPYISKISCFKGWSNYGGINIISNSRSGYWSEARITFDGTKSYLEIFFTRDIPSLSVFLNQEVWQGGGLFSGTLPNGGGTVITSAKFGRLNISENDFFVNYSGNVGIGTTNPNSKLTIEGGTINFNTTSKYGGDYPTDNNNYNNVLAIGGIGAETGLKIFKQNSGSAPTFIGGYNYVDTYVFEMTDSNNPDPDGGILFGATGNDDVFEKIMTIRGNGRVGIGTTNPQSLLAVAGIITAKEVKVTLTGWSDFVFEPNYNLISLEDLEQYIKQNKHLPDVPSAEEVKENGLNLGQSDAILLQKIEELTLYVIEQNKMLKAQNEKIMELEKQNNKIIKLEKKLKNWN